MNGDDEKSFMSPYPYTQSSPVSYNVYEILSPSVPTSRILGISGFGAVAITVLGILGALTFAVVVTVGPTLEPVEPLSRLIVNL